MSRHTKRYRRRRTKRHRRTPRAGVRMSGTQPTRRSARIRANTARSKSKKAFSLSAMLEGIEEIGEKEVKGSMRRVRKTGKSAFKAARKTTKKAAKIAKTIAKMPVDDLTALFSGFKM